MTGGPGWRRLPVVPDAPGVPSAEELSALAHAVVAVRLAEAYWLIARLTARVDQLGTPGSEGVTAQRRHQVTDIAPAPAPKVMKYEDMILSFAARPDLDIFTNNEAERTIRLVKVQQRSSGGCWRTLQGLAGCSPSSSPCLSTAAKWGIPRIDASAASSTGAPGCRPDSSPPGSSFRDGHGTAVEDMAALGGVPVTLALVQQAGSGKSSRAKAPHHA